MTTPTDFLRVAAAVVERQAQETLTFGVPVDPDVADYMGAFEETALTEDDLDDVSDGGDYDDD